MNFCKNSLLLLVLFACSFLGACAQDTYPVNGVADQKHVAFVFTNARIYIDYKTRIDTAMLVVREGKIEAVGKALKVPVDAVMIDLKGKFVYPSFIDVYADCGMPEARKARVGEDGYPQFLSNTRGAYNWNQAIRPETDAYKLFSNDDKKADELRKLGFGAALTHQKDGIARGTGVFVVLSDEKENKCILKDRASAHYSFEKGSSTQDYPSSLMGSIALLRQTYYDARWYQQASTNPLDAEYNISLDAFNKEQSLPQVFEVCDKYAVLRADRLAKEFGVQYIIKGNGDEYQRVQEIAATKMPLILPVNFPASFDMEDIYDGAQPTLGEMKHWELASYNPWYLQQAGVPFAFTTSDLKDKKDFIKNVRKAIEHGLTEEQALRALTETPAALLLMQNQVGALRPGMVANFTISTKPIFDKDNILMENWVAGKQFIINDTEPKDLRGIYEFHVASLPVLKASITGELNDPKLLLDDDTAKAKGSISRNGKFMNISFELMRREPKGILRLSSDPDRMGSLSGKAQLPDGTWVPWNAVKVSELVAEAKKDTVKKVKETPGDVTFPNRAYGWHTKPTAESILIKNATVWTNEQEGILQNTDVYISGGKIVKVGKDLASSPELKVALAAGKTRMLDGTGKHLAAGIIDEHSHIAITRGVNEGTQAVTSEVRIGDVVTADDINIYRALSGGVTSAHLLHGSSNPIGGQTQLIKLRWGLTPEQMKFEQWPGFIKFALGENVKQSNWGDKQTSRFPQTRMGVEQVFVDAFIRAKEYEQTWKKYEGSKGKGVILAPRRDLELDALVEILNNKRFITCHSYVQSEINMLMHVSDSLGFKVNTFTHILEGYKVADKMKAHGVGASTFADWWAYKNEVMEAIPYNAAILHDEGVLVAINSDDPEMGRRLNQEAAKAVKYGGVTEEEAWKFVTLNPAKLLHIDSRVGSIKAGKDADLVLWSDNPLSIYAKALTTLVDGVVYFDIDQDIKLREEIKSEKARLTRLMLDAKKNGDKTQKAGVSFEELYKCDTMLKNY